MGFGLLVVLLTLLLLLPSFAGDLVVTGPVKAVFAEITEAEALLEALLLVEKRDFTEPADDTESVSESLPSPVGFVIRPPRLMALSSVVGSTAPLGDDGAESTPPLFWKASLCKSTFFELNLLVPRASCFGSAAAAL